MHNNKAEHIMLKATIKNIIVAFIFVIIIILAIEIPFASTISKAVSLINMISISVSENQTGAETTIDTEKKSLTNYPSYGTQYATIKIESLDIELPLYYGDTLSILKKGVGQSSGAYFPGEGGSIICMGHNTSKFLIKLPDIEIGAKIEINTTYGDYTYTVYETKVVYQTDTYELPVQRDEEILMLYTCYPVNVVGYAKYRFVAYASLDT